MRGFGDELVTSLGRHLRSAIFTLKRSIVAWTLRRTHATLLQTVGGSLKDAQSQMGHSKLSTTFEIYTVPLPEHQREAVENLARLVTNGDELPKAAPEPQLLTEQIQ